MKEDKKTVETPKNENFVVKRALLEQVISYLSRCPYREVAGFLQSLQTCKPIIIEEPKDAPD